MKVSAYELAQRWVGTKELPGTGSNPFIIGMLRLDSSWPGEDAVPWCLAGATEILTEDGFIRLDELKEGISVAQVDPLGRVSYALPTRHIRKDYRGPLVKIASRDFSLVCDPEHRFWGRWIRPVIGRPGPGDPHSMRPMLRPISTLERSLSVPTVCTANDKDDPAWSDRDLALFAAFLSDGFYERGSRTPSAPPWRISVQVSRPRKLEALAGMSPASTYTASRAYGRSRAPLTTFQFAISSQLELACEAYKTPRWSLLRTWSRRQLVHFLLTYVTFDGQIKRGSHILYTSEPRLRDWLQAAVALAGYHSSWRQSSTSPFSGRPCYQVIFCPSKQTRTIRADKLERDEGRADLYCVEVPMGMIVIRDQAGTVIPTGNCSAFTNFIAWQLRLPRSKSLAARSWLAVGIQVSRADAEVGFDVVVLKRGDGSGASAGSDVVNAPGHVGFFGGNEDNHVLVLGGNQGDAVSLARFPASKILGIRRLA